LIHVVNYGLGNVGAFLSLYRKLGIPAVSASTESQLADADHVILPGVGSFDKAMQSLNASGMREMLEHLVVERHVPVLGVCVGMQMLGNSSDEGSYEGLGWISGHVRCLTSRGPAHRRLPLPHMGWNNICATKDVALLDGIPDALFYFLHSFYFDNNDATDAAATVEYGSPFTCMVNRGNVWGVQFHPEKSHRYGIALLKNFAEI
jgi:glutamine amidotransferase